LATATSEKTFEWNGRQVTYAQYKYEMARQNNAAIDAVNTLLVEDATKVLSVAADYGQQEFGGYLRTIVPGLIDKYGQVNAAVAVKYYQESRDFWFNNIYPTIDVQDSRRAAARYATAKTRGVLQYDALMPKYSVMDKAEPVIGYAMKTFMGDGYEPAARAARNAMTRAVASYHRDAILYNAGLDEAVYRVQRVARPGACAFCAMKALGSSRTWGSRKKVSVGTYAAHYHDHCSCSIETLYLGDKPIRPDYYDDFEAEYIAANGSLSKWRQMTGRK
jgi:hypothetical protein